MFAKEKSFSSISMPDLNAGKKFYSEVMGFDVTMHDSDPSVGDYMMIMHGGGTLMAYQKPDHVAAAYTAFNIPVDNVEDAVDRLVAAGVTMEIYPTTDAKGIDRTTASGVAWFKDPAGNIISVLEGVAA